MLKVSRITQTCSACPSQWEGEGENGEYIYIRYRWGGLSLDVNRECVYFIQHGDDLAGYLEADEMQELLSDYLDFNQAEWYEDDGTIYLVSF